MNLEELSDYVEGVESKYLDLEEVRENSLIKTLQDFFCKNEEEKQDLFKTIKEQGIPVGMGISSVLKGRLNVPESIGGMKLHFMEELSEGQVVFMFGEIEEFGIIKIKHD